MLLDNKDNTSLDLDKSKDFSYYSSEVLYHLEQHALCLAEANRHMKKAMSCLDELKLFQGKKLCG